jgi:carbon monoxide dehydrogenase subunit G
MEMTGSQPLAAGRDEVWAALNDPQVLQQCITGCSEIEAVGSDQWKLKISVKFGPVKASFAAKIMLSEQDPPNSYTLSGEGQGGAAGFAKGRAQVRLESTADDTTTLHYDAKVDVGGKLAQLGNRLIDSTARKFAGEFFEKFGTLFNVAPAALPVAETSGPP